MAKRIPIGISDFKALIEGGYYFVDKSELAREIVESSLITLLPRPRRFGKTLNLSMLRYFFEKTEENVYRPLFNGLAIERWEGFEHYQGKYPVIFITFKECKTLTFQGTMGQVAYALQSEFIRHNYLLDQEMNDGHRKCFTALMNGWGTQTDMENSLLLLTRLLTQYHGIAPIVLFDEYDSPIHVAYTNGYYREMVDFMRIFMGSVFKDNTEIFKGVITGIMRVAKESLFSGLNNLKVCSLLMPEMNRAFGFTQEEVDRMLSDYGLSSYREEVKRWYDGYCFGGLTIYNPWSVLMFMESMDKELRPYWVNTASDSILRELLKEGPDTVRREMEQFIKGEYVLCEVNDNTAFPELARSRVNIWSFMVFCGYLKARYDHREEENRLFYRIEVPNLEVSFVFRTIVKEWISGSPVFNERLVEMLQALTGGDIRMFERILNEFVVRTLSYFDTGGKNVEKVYQAFLLGMLVNLPDYEVTSNREAGYGRYDILLRPKKTNARGIVMELKVCDTDYGEDSEAALASALAQIEEKRYEEVLRAAGVTDILKLAITFDGKQVWVRQGKQAEPADEG